MKQKNYNREQVRKARLGKFWCMKCDLHLVGVGQKCPGCRHTHGPKRNRK